MDFSGINPHTARIFLLLLQQIAENNQPVYRRTSEEKEGITKDNSESGPTN